MVNELCISLAENDLDQIPTKKALHTKKSVRRDQAIDTGSPSYEYIFISIGIEVGVS
jgi:hypothetical protein